MYKFQSSFNPIFIHYFINILVKYTVLKIHCIISQLQTWKLIYSFQILHTIIRNRYQVSKWYDSINLVVFAPTFFSLSCFCLDPENRFKCQEHISGFQCLWILSWFTSCFDFNIRNTIISAVSCYYIAMATNLFLHLFMGNWCIGHIYIYIPISFIL